VSSKWKEMRLGDVFKLEYGKPLLPSLRTKDGKHFAYGANGPIAKTNRFYWDKPSIIVGRKGSAGELKLVEEPFWPLDVTYFTVFDEDKYELKFLYFLLQSLNLPSLAQGVKPGINRNDVYSIRKPIPPLPEQRRIVGMLDKIFDGLAKAKANTEQNLRDAKRLYEQFLNDTFRQNGLAEDLADGQDRVQQRFKSIKSSAVQSKSAPADLDAGDTTKTGGRKATQRIIPGPLSLSVGIPPIRPRKGWRWSLLSDLARLESGHTPSRRHPEWWGGDVSWISIQDAKKHHGKNIYETSETTNRLGIENSSARVLPAGTVCLSRTASVGYVLVMGCPMATSQDFVNWVCDKPLLPDFLKFIFLAEGRDGLLRYSSGAVHQTIYFPEAKAFAICHPSTQEQATIVERCGAISEQSQRLSSNYRNKLLKLDDLRASILRLAFSGAL